MIRCNNGPRRTRAIMTTTACAGSAAVDVDPRKESHTWKSLPCQQVMYHRPLFPLRQ